MAENNPEQLAPADDHQIKRKGSDRRTHGDRRHNVAPWTGAEHRNANRRNANDRRGLPFGIFYKTGEPMHVLYDWLRDRCSGKWSVGIEAAEENPLKKSVKVLFELENDKQTFLTDVIRG